jgi:hypothetical protein
MRRSLFAAAAALAGAFACLPAIAQAPHESHSIPEPAANGTYAPRLADMMILQQIRHAKLWFAAAASNWDLAEHALDAIKVAFSDVAKLYPTVYAVSTEPVVTRLAERELADLARAIEAQDRLAFTIAFDKLTDACNACHRSTRHAFIVVQQPISSPLNNQSFVPLRGSLGNDPLHRHPPP